MHKSVRRCALIASALAAVTAAPALARDVAATSGSLSIHGTIKAFDGQHRLQVVGKGGAITEVRLREGTVIRPRGLPLKPGMRVAVMGTPSASGSTLNAREIDAPYHAVRTAAGPGYTPFAGYSYNQGSPVTQRKFVPNAKTTPNSQR